MLVSTIDCAYLPVSIDVLSHKNVGAILGGNIKGKLRKEE
jgi:hypothetical protein